VTLPEGRRELSPSREAMGDRPRPGFGSRLNISVPISFGLPLIVVGLFVLFTGVSHDKIALIAVGAVALLGGLLLFASGKRL
jgi:hypothetical protein